MNPSCFSLTTFCLPWTTAARIDVFLPPSFRAPLLQNDVSRAELDFTGFADVYNISGCRHTGFFDPTIFVLSFSPFFWGFPGQNKCPRSILSVCRGQAPQQVAVPMSYLDIERGATWFLFLFLFGVLGSDLFTSISQVMTPPLCCVCSVSFVLFLVFQAIALLSFQQPI